MLEAKNIKF